MGKKAKKKWIQRAIEEEGSLTDYVKRRWGKEGFTKKGTIKVKILNQIIRDYKQGKVSLLTYRRAILAKNLKKIAKKKKKKRKKKKGKKK